MNPLITKQEFTGPLFIVGMPRSGTKLLRDLLNNHPLIAIPDIETRLLPTWVKNWPSYGDLSQQSVFNRFYLDTIHLSYFHYMEERDQLITAEEWYELCRDFSPSGVFEALIRHDTGTEYDTPVIWGDKSPLYFRYVPLLKELFPAARFVHIIRDVRDYCLSINKAWGKNMIRAAQRWSDDVRQFKLECRNLEDSCLEVKYENLIAEPELTLNEICNFLEIEFYPEMMSLSKESENLGDAKGFRTIKKDNKYKYLFLMKPDARKKIEMITADILRSYEYVIEYSGNNIKISKVKLLIYQFLDGINLFLFDIREYNFLNAVKRSLDFYRMKR